MMRAAVRSLICSLAISLAGVVLAQQPLPNLKVDFDGEPVQMSTVMLELNTYLVPLREAVKIFTRGRGVLGGVPGQTFEISVDGKMRVRIPSSPKGGQSVEVFGPEGPLQVVRRTRIESYPYEVTPKGGAPTMYIDVELLAASLGISVDVDGANLSLLSPEYWCSQVGIQSAKSEDQTIRNLQNLPEFGISPPARTILCWLRPAQSCFVQTYRIEDGKIYPMFATNGFGDPVDVPTPGDTVKMRAATTDRALRFETYSYGDSVGHTVSFVSVISTTDLGSKDPVKAINSGQLKPGDYAVVGLRQRVSDMAVLFDNVAVRAGEDLADFAERNKNSPSIVRVLNGLHEGEKPAAGTKLCVMSGLDEARIGVQQQSRYEFKGLYEVQNGDSLKSLASSWGVTPEDLLATNPGIAGGAEPNPGDLLNVISKKDGVPTQADATAPISKEDTAFAGTAVTLVNADVHETSKMDSKVVGQIPKSHYIEVLGKIGNGEGYRVRYEQLMGFVSGSAVHLRDSGPAPAGPATASNDIVAREALKYLGTPYLWGGNSLSQGIDCSHFVAQIYERIGWKEPPPPVTTQEAIGAIVHCKPGQARRAGQTITLPSRSFPYATTDLRSLKSGDRIIFQRGNTDASGSRHTGIFIGRVPDSWRKRFGDIPYAFAHASSSRGVTVGSLTARYYWGIYKFSVRSEKR